MAQLTERVLEGIETAYKMMATKAKYRPAAPSDGVGNITVDEEQLDLDKESADYAEQWWKEEDRQSFYIGCCDFRSRAATIFAIEAARNMCAGTAGNLTALRLLKLAVNEMEQITTSAK